MASCQSVDFISLLPPELVVKIALALGADDVTRCLLVCRAWCRRLSELEPFWRVACRRMGLSEAMVRTFRPQCESSRALYLTTLRHARSLSAPPPTCLTLTRGYPFDVRYSCQYARDGYIVGTVYQHFKPKEIVVEAVREGKIVRTHTLQPGFERRSENRVVWGRLAGSVYVCVTASGKWTAYDLNTHSVQFQWRGDPLYDTDLRIGCCDKCLLVGIAKLVSFHTVDEQSFWDLKFIQLGAMLAGHDSQVLRFKLHTGNPHIVGRKVGYGQKRVWLLSGDLPTCATPTETSCANHLVLLQWANSVAGHVLSWKEESAILSRSPHLCCSVSCPEMEAAVVKNIGLNTPFHLSADSQLLGMVFQAKLHVWDVWSGKLLSSASLPLRSHLFEQIKLVAVGHIYSVVGLEFSNSLLVVLTQTGRVVQRCDDFAQRHCRMVPPFIEFLCTCSEQWMSDLRVPCTEEQCTVVYWNKTNRSLEGVLLGEGGTNHDREQPLTTKRKSWWKIW